MNKAYRKVYDSSDIEIRWIHEWESRSLYSMSKDNNIDDKTFSIQLPPPYVTGTLHMGHAFNQTLMDILVRWNRMLGKKSNLSFSEVRDRYETFRARCLDDKGSNVQFSSKKTMKNKNNKSIGNEKGCVKPLHGDKSKCVIKIVPKNERCSSFQMDPKCRLHRK